MASALIKFCRFSSKSQKLSRLKQFSERILPSRSIFRQSNLCGSTPLFMPSLSPTMSEGTIVKWHKKEGDAINPGDILCDIQTDKAVVTMDIEEEGILAKILKPENTKDLKVGSMIAVMVDEGDDWQNVEVPAEAEVATSDSSSDSSSSSSDEEVAAAMATAGKGTVGAPVSELHKEQLHQHGIGPSIRKLIEEYHVNVNEIKGSGPQDRLTKGDVMRHIKSQNLPKVDQTAISVPAAPLPPTTAPPTEPSTIQPSFVAPPLPLVDAEEFIDIPNTGMRSTIAKRLTESKTTIPHSYVTIDCNVGPVTQLRKQLANEKVKVSVNDFIIKSAAIALQRVPQINSVWQGEEAHGMTNVDISVAVATKSGLITPIVKNTPFLTVEQISDTVKDLATRAKENQLQLHEFQGGTFTMFLGNGNDVCISYLKAAQADQSSSISNLGMFGISEFSAVINPPQTAIMAIGSSRVCLNSEGKPESRMSATLSYDARIVDETDASSFLEVFRDIMENPQMTIVGSNLSRRLSAEL